MLRFSRSYVTRATRIPDPLLSIRGQAGGAEKHTLTDNSQFFVHSPNSARPVSIPFAAQPTTSQNIQGYTHPLASSARVARPTLMDEEELKGYHRFAPLLNPRPKGSNTSPTISDAALHQMRQLRSQGASQTSLGKKFSLSRTQIARLSFAPSAQGRKERKLKREEVDLQADRKKATYGWNKWYVLGFLDSSRDSLQPD